MVRVRMDARMSVIEGLRNQSKLDGRWTAHSPPSQSPTDLSKRKLGGPKEKEKKEEENPNKDEDDHPFRVGACAVLALFLPYILPSLHGVSASFACAEHGLMMKTHDIHTSGSVLVVKWQGDQSDRFCDVIERGALHFTGGVVVYRSHH